MMNPEMMKLAMEQMVGTCSSLTDGVTSPIAFWFDVGLCVQSKMTPDQV